MELSLVIPVRNEVDNIPRLADEIDAAFADSTAPWECIWVDDGSDDGTLPALKLLHGRNPVHQYVSLTRSCGQSAALSVGIEHIEDILADLEQALGVDGGIDLCGRERRVAKQLLDGAQIAAASEEMRRKGMP